MVYWCKIVELYLGFRFCVSERTQIGYEIKKIPISKKILYLLAGNNCVSKRNSIVVYYICRLTCLFVSYTGYSFVILHSSYLWLLPSLHMWSCFTPVQLTPKKGRKKMWSSG